MRLNFYADMTDASLVEYVNMFPELRGKMMARAGYGTKKWYRGRYTNKTDDMYLNLHQKSRSSGKNGKKQIWMANYSVQQLNQYKTRSRVTSIPLNLYENGRMIRAGKRKPDGTYPMKHEPGKKIFKKVAFEMSGKMSIIANRTVKEVLDGIEQS